jgi:hypothetical protein
MPGWEDSNFGIGQERSRARGASIFGESAENAPQRLFAFELWGEGYAAAARYCQTHRITAVLRASSIIAGEL